MEFDPSYVKFTSPEVGIKAEEKVTVTARNADFTVTNITSNNAAFDIIPKSFVLNEGQSIELTVSYLPPDSGYVYSRFDFESLPCITKFYASGGWPGKRPTIRTIKLIHPNGGEVFVAGSDTVITWEGVPPEEPVMLEYRTDDDQPWVIVSDSATGLSHPFRAPNIVSKKYLARVTAKTTYQSCDNPDVELCGKVWMGCNLDVEHYRNGEPIRQAQTVDEWRDAGDNEEGAWCYYDNDPANGYIYGKLYNWYAVNDPRGLAPEGWHVPTDEEWTELEDCLKDNDEYWCNNNSENIAKSLASNDLWNVSGYSCAIGNDLSSNNKTGFAGMPSGYRYYYNDDFYYIEDQGHWWTSTESSSSGAVNRYLFYYYSIVNRFKYPKRNGFSVRCVRD